MWTSMLDLDPKRVLVTQLLRRIWPGACFSSFAPLQVRNLPRQPLPKQTWVRVRNRLAGICGSDLHLVQADGDFRIAPAAIPHHAHSYPGHEVVGEVLEIGENVQHIRVGDRVALQYGPNCLSTGVQTPCRSCAQGHYSLCEYGEFPPPHPIGGGWSEEMLLPEQQLFRLPSAMKDEQAVLIEPTAVAIHAVLRRPPHPGERILIIGAGTIGLLTLQFVRSLVPNAEISVMARHPFQIEQATRMGATHIIYPEDSYSNVQQTTNAQLHKGLFGNQSLLGGYDIIYDSVGHQQTLHHALRWARAQATVVLIGVHLHMMHIDLTPIWYQEINLIGSTSSGIDTWPLGTHEQLSTFEIAAQLITQGQLQPERLITHHFPLNNYQTALLTAMGKARSRAIKVVFDYSLLPPSVVPNIRASASRTRRSVALEPMPPSPQPVAPAIPATPASTPAASNSVESYLQRFDISDRHDDTIKMPILTKRIIQATVSNLPPRVDESATIDPTQKESFAASPETTTQAAVPAHQGTETPLELAHPTEDGSTSSYVSSDTSTESPEHDAAKPTQDADEPFRLLSMSLREAMDLFDPEATSSTVYNTEAALPSPSTSNNADLAQSDTTSVTVPTREEVIAAPPTPNNVALEQPDTTSAENAQIIDDSFLLPSIALREASELPEPASAETVQIIDQSFLSPSLAVRKVVEHSEPEEISDHSEAQPIESGQHDPEPSETPSEPTMLPTELPDPSTTETASEPFLEDTRNEEKNEIVSATSGTEIALSQEEPATARIQSRPRTRKKSNRN